MKDEEGELELKDEEKKHEHHHHGRLSNLPEGVLFKTCEECRGMHMAEDACLKCNTTIFGDEKFCPNCGSDQKKVHEDADGYCTHCHHDLHSQTALDDKNDDYECPGCHRTSEQGIKFKFKSDDARLAFYKKAKEAAEKLEEVKEEKEEKKEEE